MQTGKPETVTFVPVAFSDEEFKLLVGRVEVDEGSALAEYIHKTAMRSLNRKKRVKAEDQG